MRSDPTPRGVAGPRLGEVEEQLGRQAPGELAQLLVGRTGEIGQQRQGLVGVVLERVVERLLVDHADLRRDLVEARR